MEIIRVTETWQLAAVHYLRIQVALSLAIPLAGKSTRRREIGSITC